MALSSRYGKVASEIFFGRRDLADLQPIESDRAICTSMEQAKLLSMETITFQTATGPVELEVDVASNNQLLGACREIAEFAHGYEPEIHTAIDLLTLKDSVIFDIGSNWGPISLQLALRPDFCGKIYAFEPQSGAHANLIKMVEKLTLETKLKAMNIAVSDISGEARLSAPVWGGNVAVTSAEEGESCTLARLDEMDLPAPHLIKIDVEGHESKVLSGAQSLLQRFKPIVIFEDWLDQPKAHFHQLEQLGYHFYALGWHNPFSDTLEFKPPFEADIQFFAMELFESNSRHKYPERINVLATPAALMSI